MDTENIKVYPIIWQLFNCLALPNTPGIIEENQTQEYKFDLLEGFHFGTEAVIDGVGVGAELVHTTHCDAQWDCTTGTLTLSSVTAQIEATISADR